MDNDGYYVQDRKFILHVKGSTAKYIRPPYKWSKPNEYVEYSQKVFDEWVKTGRLKKMSEERVFAELL